MAIPVYSTQFISEGAFSSYTYTAQPGYVTLVSCIDVYVGITGGGGAFIARGAAGQVFWQTVYPPTVPTWSSWRGKLVLAAGETFTVEATDIFDCSASG